MVGLFEELRKNGEAAIDSWIDDCQGESLYFDCKAKTDPKKPQIDRDDRKNLGKALSAFANSDGGLLLWGVDARVKGGVDCLVCKKPIAQIAAFRSNVEREIADVISPPIPGLELLEILCSQVEGAGYLAILVPNSERRPHMSRNNTAPGFYFRNGHKSVLMEPFQVRDQMLRRAVPRLEFDWDMRVRHDEISRANAQRLTVPVSLDLILKNNSVISARFPYLILRVDRGRYVSMGNQYQEFAKNGVPIARVGPIEMRAVMVDAGSMSRDTEFAGGADTCVHPGTALRIAAIRLEAPADPHVSELNGRVTHRTLQPRYAELLTVIMEVAYGCLDAPCEKIPLELKASDMLAKLFSNGQSGPVILP
jgi:hypothetical protein